MSAPDRKPEAVQRAERKGHTVESDPVAGISRALRWTCTKCGGAALDYDGHIYGSAVTRGCTS